MRNSQKKRQWQVTRVKRAGLPGNEALEIRRDGGSPRLQLAKLARSVMRTWEEWELSQVGSWEHKSVSSPRRET